MRKCILFAVILLSLTLVGCSEYHADIPEYTTSSDRDTGFIPKTEGPLPSSTDNDNLDNKVQQGFADVEKKASLYSQEIEEKSANVEDLMSAAQGDFPVH